MPKITLGKKGLRAALTGTLVGGFYLAGHFMLPEYYAFTRFDLPAMMDMGNIMSTILLVAPAMAGGAGYVVSTTPSIIKGLKIPALGKAAGAARAGEAAAQQPAVEQPVAQVEQVAAQPTAEQVAVAAQQPAPAAPSMDDTVAMIEDMVGKKMGEMLNDVTTMKNEVVAFQGDVGKMKDDIKNLTVSFESSLTDLKAFQAEMVNPLNFMRNYFETMDIKSLSDPVQALPQVEVQQKAPAAQAVMEAKPPAAQDEKKPEQTAVVAAELKTSVHNDDDNSKKKKEVPAAEPAGEEPAAAQPEQTALRQLLPEIAMQGRGGEGGGEVPMVADVKQFSGNSSGNGSGHSGQIFSGGLTLGKLMSMVSMLEKLLRDMGPDDLEVMIEQYRQFGLKTEDEAAIYNVVGMLKDFGMSADEVMVRLYRLGQMMGIRDPQADLEYAKLQARKSRKMSPAATAEPAAKERRVAFDG